MPALLERPKMTRAMYEALKRHIMHEREKKKQAEQEQDAMMERLKKERELRKRKEEQDSSTLEQTSEQISHLKDKLELLKKQKSELFSQLKRVLHHEDETRRRAQQKEQSELTVTQQAPYQHTTHGAVPQPMVMHGRPALYKPTASAAMQSGLKRQRSPSPTPTPASSYQSYSHNEAKYPHTLDSKYPHVDPKYPSHIDPKFVHSDPKYLTSYGATKPMQSSHPSLAQPVDYKSSVYPPTGTSHLYGANPNFQQQATTVAGSYSSGSKYVSTGQSAFTSYQSQFAQSHPQKALADQFSSAYPIQRMQQPGYHTGIQLQQPLDNPVAKQPGFEEKYKLGPGQIRGMGPSQQQTQMTQAMQLQQQQQQQQQVKTAAPFAQSYQARPPATPSGSAYPTSTAGSNTFTRHSISQGRPGYGSQTHNRYF